LKPWLNIVGIGQDGLSGLSDAVKDLLKKAEVIFGSSRHHQLTSTLDVSRVHWPKPFDLIYEKIASYRGKIVVVLVTGDPLWFSAGIQIKDFFVKEEIIFYPHISAFQSVAARMIWPMSEIEMLSVHGRPLEKIIPYLQPNQKLIVLTSGSETPKEIAELLTDRNFGKSKMTVFSSMGDKNEQLFFQTAENWKKSVPSFNTLAIECLPAGFCDIVPKTPGLSDNVFKNDGTMTKREVRAVTLSKLKPTNGAVLWDIGCGCGSVSIEWMRSASNSVAIGVDKRADRCELSSINAINLGVPDFKVINGQAPEALHNLDKPDAIFIGGGLSKEIFEFSWSQLTTNGRLVVNVVTLKSQALLLELYSQYGGDISQLEIKRVEQIGDSTIWKPLTAVTQWSIEKK
jgi:precorrin-6Y C5,15-methyltransferase (decarboxylating)